MNELIEKVTNEAVLSVATHYNTTEQNVRLAVSNGNEKVLKAINDIVYNVLMNLSKGQ